MSTNQVTSAGTTAGAGYTYSSTSKANTASSSSGSTENQSNPGYIYEKSGDTKTYKPDYATIEKLKNQSNAQVESFKNLVRKLLMKQGNTAQDAFEAFEKLGQKGQLSDDVKAAAEELISEDGYYGVKKTSERLVEFAKALTGGDPSQIETMRDAVQQGFKEAERMWGGKMPEITQKTYDATMKLFDDWAESAKTSK